MSARGRSASPQARDMDVDMDKPSELKPEPKVVVITNLTRNVVEAHLRVIFGFYGEVVKIDLPTYAKSGQNKGKAALEYADASSARTAVSHMNGGQLDGAALKVELSDTPVFHRTRSRSPPLRQQQQQRNGRDRDRAPRSLSRPRSRSPPPPRFPRRERDFSGRAYNATGDSYRRAPPTAPLRRPPPPQRDVYRPRSRSRSRSPIRRPGGALGTRRRSPSYERGGYGRRGRSRSYSSSVRSSRTGSRSPSRSRSRSRSFSRSRSRSRTRSRSLSPSYSSWSRGRSRSRSYSRGRRSYSRDDIRDSRSRSPPPKDV
ncbi:hypothetical protein EDB89DRAFT_516394 [Lactarius sanguifluus]|nr:hypothetical protein EDB89DRAFT_516394 [Lactarius sanguifluus]